MTTTPIEGFPTSQEEYSEWSEKYTPPTAVGEPWTQTINANELDAGSDLVMPDTTTAPNGAAAVLNAKGVSDMAKAEATRLKEIQDALNKAEEEKKSWVDKLAGKKTSKADTLTAQQTKYDISGKLDQLSSITNLTLPLQTQMADLEARQQREIDRNDERLASSVAKDREANAIDLRYAKLQAPLAAKLNAYAAQAQAVQGNLSIANQFIDQAVNAAVYDQEFEYNRTKDIMDANQDYIDGLEDDERDILNNIQALKLDEFNNAKTEKTAIGQLIVKYNQYGAGITFDDTLEEASIKAGNVSTEETDGTTTQYSREWEEAGGLAGTGMTKAQWIMSRTGVSDELTANQTQYLSSLMSEVPKYENREAALKGIELIKGTVILTTGQLGYDKLLTEIDRIFPALPAELTPEEIKYQKELDKIKADKAMEGLNLTPGAPSTGGLTVSESDDKLTAGFWSDLFNDSGISIGVTK